MMNLVEECSGTGDLIRNGQFVRQVRYRLSRYQGMLGGSALPVPGHRIEGSIDFDRRTDAIELIGADLTLRLEDGRALGITLAGSDGRILSRGHGVQGCSCC